MFEFENKEYEIVKEFSTQGGHYGKKNKELLQNFQECIENLSKWEVEFILALRSLDSNFRANLSEVIYFWHRDREKYYRYIDKMVSNRSRLESLIKKSK